MSEIQEDTISASEDIGDKCNLKDTSSEVTPSETPPSIEKDDVQENLPSSTTGIEELEPTLESKPNNITPADSEPLSSPAGSVNLFNSESEKKSYEKETHDSKKDAFSEFKLNSPLAAWMKEQNINSCVLDLIYWRDLKNTGIVFGSGLLILMSLQYCSFISVFSNLGLSFLLVSFLYRIGMTIVNGVQKRTAEHPFKRLLESEIEIPVDKVSRIAEKISQYINRRISVIQKLFLVSDVVDSIKFGLVLWLLTYVGAMCSLMTMLLIVFVAVFTIPKLYEEKQKEVDQLIEMASNKTYKLYSAVESKLPAKMKVYLQTKKEQ